jgi:hypothetical protein
MQRTFIGPGLALTILLSVLLPSPLQARGGFGGGGFHAGGGGGFREGGFAEGGFRDTGIRDGGFRDDGGMRSDSFRDFDRSFDHPFGEERPDAFTGPRDSARSNPADNGVRNYAPQRSLASDGGFANVMKSASSLPSGRQTWHATPAALATQARSVRTNFHNYDAFHGDWWGRHPYAWRRPWWNNYPYWPWMWTSWSSLAPFWGVDASDLPIYYDYGDNITYDDGGNVDYGSDPVCSAGDYYKQSYDLAGAGQSDDYAAGNDTSAEPSQPAGTAAPAQSPAPDASGKSGTTDSADWKALGVFSLVQGNETNSSTLFQLCTNKKGQIRGNYYNALTDETEPVKGSIDKKRMRACWTVGNNSLVVYDTGIANLLKGESPVLVHFDRNTTQQWTLVRMKNMDTAASKK